MIILLPGDQKKLCIVELQGNLEWRDNLEYKNIKKVGNIYFDQETVLK